MHVWLVRPRYNALQLLNSLLNWRSSLLLFSQHLLSFILVIHTVLAPNPTPWLQVLGHLYFESDDPYLSTAECKQVGGPAIFVACRAT